MKMFKICSVNVQKTILKLQTTGNPLKTTLKNVPSLFDIQKKCLLKVVQDLVLKNSRKIFIPKTFKKICSQKLHLTTFWKIFCN